MRLVSSVTWVPTAHAAEEVDSAAFAHHLDGLFPGLRHADGLDGDVDAAIIWREGAGLADGFAEYWWT